MTASNNIEKIISELLYNNDCVIVPGFGGFVTVYKPATILAKQNVMLPPSREIGFNKKLINNDGLLANQIATKNGLTFDESLRLIQKRVAFYQSELTRVKRLEITNIGVLYIDKDGKYRFMPDESKNFLKKSFGLNKIYLDPIEVKKKETSTTETKIIPITHEEKKPFAWRKIAGVAALALFLLGGYWLGSKLDDSNVSLAMFNPFKDKSKKIIVTDYHKDINRPSWNDKQESTSTAFEEMLENTTAKTINYSFDEESNADEHDIVIRTNNNSKNGNTEPKTTSPPSSITTTNPVESSNEISTYNYYIVAGAFQERTNADKLVNKLKNKGFNAHIFAKKNNLNYVCFDGYATKSAAKAHLAQAKRITPSAWVKAN